MKDNVDRTAVGPMRLTRRQFLRLAALSSGALVVEAGCDINIGNQQNAGQPDSQGPTAVGEATFTEAPSATQAPSPTPNYDKQNFDKVDRADVGENLVLTNVTIYGFARVSGSIPLTDITATDHYALAARPNEAGTQADTYAVVTGATCLWEYAETNGFLDESKRDGNPNSDAAVVKYTLKRPMTITEVRAEAGKDLPGTSGGKVLHISSFQPKNESEEIQCPPNSSWFAEKAKDVLEEVFLKSQDIKNR